MHNELIKEIDKDLLCLQVDSDFDAVNKVLPYSDQQIRKLLGEDTHGVSKTNYQSDYQKVI